MAGSQRVWVVVAIAAIIALPITFIAGVVAGVAIAKREFSPPAPPAIPPPRLMQMPIASADLPADRKIHVGDIVLVNMTAAQLQDRGAPLASVMMDPEQIVGRTLKSPLKQGDFFTIEALYLEGDGPADDSTSPPSAAP
jgi:flagella basal body P-ring formation protein FlgA